MSQRVYYSINESACGWKRGGQEKFLLVTALLAILFSLCALSMTLVAHMQERNQQILVTALNDTPIVCVPCNQLVRDVNDHVHTDPIVSQLSVVKSRDGANKCCAYNSAQLSLVFELAMSHEKPPESLLEFDPADFSFSQVSAHKRLYPPETTNKEAGPSFKNLVVTHFKNVTEFPEHARGVDVRGDGLCILTSGQYYIYSSIHIRPDSVETCKEFKYQTWGHYIEKMTPNDPAASHVILKSAQTCCDECAGADETNFTGGMFELKRGDVIRIKVTGLGLVHFRKFSSFAGLVMLGGGSSRK